MKKATFDQTPNLTETFDQVKSLKKIQSSENETFDQVKNETFDQVKFDQLTPCLRIVLIEGTVFKLIRYFSMSLAIFFFSLTSFEKACTPRLSLERQANIILENHN